MAQAIFQVCSACLVLVTLALAACSATAAPSFFVGGDYLVSVLSEEGELQHVAGVAGFDAESNQYDANATGGGVIATTSSSQRVCPEQLEWGPS